MLATNTNKGMRNAIGAHSGSYSIYRALAVAAGALDPVYNRVCCALGEVCGAVARCGACIKVLVRRERVFPSDPPPRPEDDGAVSAAWTSSILV